jgi:glutathione S-transferase
MVWLLNGVKNLLNDLLTLHNLKMLQYYYSPFTCTLAGMIALEATGVAYESIIVDMADRGKLFSLNGTGKVPTLVSDEFVITDTIAIIYWLAKNYPQTHLLPDSDNDVATAISMMAWMGSELHIQRRQYSRPQLFCAEVNAQDVLQKSARPRYWAGLERIDKWLEHNKLPSFGVEAYALIFYHWALIDNLPVDNLPYFRDFAARMLENPSVIRALKVHHSPLLENLQ